MPSRTTSPKGAEIRELRETYGIHQREAADMVFSTLRSWQNWEADVVNMHPAIWEWFKHSVQSSDASASRVSSEMPAKGVRYVQSLISFWWDTKDKSIHVTTQGTEPPLHTTFPSNAGSIRWHDSMFNWLRLTLEANSKPAPDEVKATDVNDVKAPIYKGRLEHVVRSVLIVAEEHRARAGRLPKAKESAQLVRDVLPLLPIGSIF
jgi:hypothetical protein